MPSTQKAERKEKQARDAKGMWASSFSHAGFSVALQAAVGLATGNWWAGGLAGVMFFLGREHMGQQKKMAEADGGSVKDLKPSDGLDMTKWGRDSLLDLLVPAVSAVAVYFWVLYGWFR